MISIKPIIENSWEEILTNEFKKSYFVDLRKFLLSEKENNIIYPPSNLIFNAFNKTPFTNVKVVILGQDPYHGENQAHGLSFSVPKGVKKPPSLVNIYKELKSDLNISIATHGNLGNWALQGVLLLNATLTVRNSEAGSHQKKGWEIFTDSVIKAISDKKENVVFILWGNYAQSKESIIDGGKHLIIKSVHPSPLSASRGFFGSKPFSKTNQYLQSKNISPICWKIE